jgi:putative serine protease PepD
VPPTPTESYAFGAPPRPPAPPQPPGPPRGTGDQHPPRPPRARTPKGPLIATAAVAALLASTATAGLTWALADAGTDTPVATAPADEDTTVVEEDQNSAVPVSTTADQPDWQAVADAVRPSVVAIAVQSAAGAGEGSGVIIDDKGHILTNDHVVSDAQQLQVTLSDGRVFEAEVVGTDPTTDLAVIQLLDPPDDLVPAELGDSDAIAVGEAVMAVGNPLGLDSTVTTGIVSALDRPVSTGSLSGTEAVVTNAIQVDAAINPGNSGGPLFNASGEVIGITSSIATLSQGSSSGSIGLGFAIPSNLAERIVGELIADGTAEHAFLGVSLSDGTATSDGTTRLGAVVEEVSAGSPAADAGLEVGDVVVAIDDDPVSGALSLTAFVRERETDDQVALTVVRDGETLKVPVTLAARAETGAAAESDSGQSSRPGR